MLPITFTLFFISLCVFTAVMLREPRTLGSGISFFILMLSLAVFLLTAILVHSDWFTEHRFFLLALTVLAVLAGIFLLSLPLLLLLTFLVEGVRVVRHEGFRPANLLSLLFAALWFGYLFIWPWIGSWQTGSLGMAVYIIISFSALYMLSLMAMYVLSALLNLVHVRKKRRLDYIVVLGAGLNGSQVTPLLAARVDRGVELLRRNPQARLILSGGQGPGEDVPESRAMAAYAAGRGVEPGRILQEDKSTTTEENLCFSRDLMAEARPRVAVVTTAYHVFRALLIAKGQGLRCVGFGAKTKWYFTLNAVLREFAGYVRLTRRRHIRVIGIAAGLVLLLYLAAR